MNILASENNSLVLPIVLAVVAVVLLAAIIIVVIKIKNKKNNTPANKTLDDRELIAENAAMVEGLIVLAKDNEELTEQLKDLQGELKYLIPSQEPKVHDFDKTIKNKIGDLRIALTKSDGEENKKTAELITDIKLAVADRNAKL